MSILSPSLTSLARLSSSILGSKKWHQSSVSGLLQHLDHESDIWYIGVYSANAALGSFTLKSGHDAPKQLAFDGGSSAVTSQLEKSWRHFYVDVPEQIGGQDVLGWEIQLTDWIGEEPFLLYADGLLPNESDLNRPSTRAYTDWAGSDNSKGFWFDTHEWIESERQYVGVYAPGVTNYTITSKPIGIGMAHDLTPIPFTGGSVVENDVPAGALRYYYVDIPASTLSWHVSLGVTTGDASLYIRKDAVPNSKRQGSHSAPPWTINPNVHMTSLKQDGDERFTLLPASGETNLPPGRYYLMVVSEPGIAVSDFALTSHGQAESPVNLGTPTETSGLSVSDTLAVDQVKRYLVTMPAGASAVEARLQGEGRMWIRRESGDSAFPSAGRGLYSGAQASTGANGKRIFSVSEPPVGEVWRVVVQSQIAGAFALTVDLVGNDSIAADGGQTIVTDQPAGSWRYIEIEVPDQVAGEMVLGWELKVANWEGATRPTLYVKKDGQPSASDWDHRSESFDWSNTTGIAGSPHGIWLANREGMPGTYYAAVFSSNLVSYSLTSRLIGPGMSIEPQPLTFTDGSVSIADLAVRDVAYAYVDIPEGTASWRVSLTATEGDTDLYIRKDEIPRTDRLNHSRQIVVGGSYQPPFDRSANDLSSLTRLDRLGSDYFTLFPGQDQTTLPAGRYYLMAAGLGTGGAQNGFNVKSIGTGQSSFTLRSHGLAEPPTDLGTPVIGSDILVDDLVEGGHIKTYTLTMPTDAASVEVYWENASSDLVGTFRTAVSDSAFGSGSSYGYFTGHAPDWPEGQLFRGAFSLPNTSPGTTWRILLAAARENEPDATYRLRVRAVGAPMLVFNGGNESVVEQKAGSWRFFEVNVADQVNGKDVAGWEVRIDPDEQYDNSLQLFLSDEGLGAFVAPGVGFLNTATRGVKGDWTTVYNKFRPRSDVPEGIWFDRSELPEGLVHIGVFVDDTYGIAPTSYSVTSRPIGEGLSHDLQTIAFESGMATVTDIEVSDYRYFYVDIPENTPSWHVSLDAVAGDSQIYLSKSILTPEDATSQTAFPARVSKEGDESFVLFPDLGDDFLSAGRYYLLASSLGVGPVYHSSSLTNLTTIGVGGSSFTLTSHGPAQETHLGEVLNTGEALRQSGSYASGGLASMTFEVPEDVLALEIALEDRVGDPQMTVNWRQNAYHSILTYGGSSTVGYDLWDPDRLTLVPPTSGVYHMIIQDWDARSLVPGSFTVGVRALVPTPLNFVSSQNGNGHSHTHSGVLANNQRAFFEVPVPSDLDGQAILGWRLRIESTSGDPEIRLQQGELPTDSTVPFTGWSSRSLVIGQAELEEGLWYIEVKGVSASDYTLLSEPILESDHRTWSMPAFGESVTTPGLVAPEFGDSGTDLAGVALPGDRGTDLGNGSFHFYAVDVPEGNVGLLRAQLEAISGNPDVYVRYGSLPTIHLLGLHPSDKRYDHGLTGTQNSEFGSFVAGGLEKQLKPGRWYVVVHAAGDSNTRYRLRLSTGPIADMALSDGTATGQALASGDWRYYRVEIPEDAPVEWSVSYAPTSGSVSLYLRDTVPPGTAAGSTQEWNSDRKNWGTVYPSSPGTHTFTQPQIRPGHRYYLGFLANQDAVFSVSSSVGHETIGLLPEIDFEGGSIDTIIPANSHAVYRVRVPEYATQWEHRATHSSGLRVNVENGSVNLLTGLFSQHYTSGTQTNSSLVRNMELGIWPWVPNETYYVSLINSTIEPQPILFAMEGEITRPPTRAFNTEMASVGLTGNDATPSAVPYGDAIPNLIKYAFNMDLSGPDAGTMNLGGNRGLPAHEIEPQGDGSTIFRIEFVRRKGSGMVYTPMWSSLLSAESFEAMTGAENVVSIDQDWERVTVTQVCDAESLRCFSQVRVILP